MLCTARRSGRRGAMFAFGAWVLFLALTAGPAPAQSTSCGYLPSNRFKWWDAAVPPSSSFGADDTIECWFDETIMKMVDFSATPCCDPAAFPGGPGFSIRRLDSQDKPSFMYAYGTVETGPGVLKQRTRTVARNSRATTEIWVDENYPWPYRPPMTLDFTLPQRAVVLEWNVMYNEGYQPIDSRGNPGIDPEGIILIAYDHRGYEIGLANFGDRHTDPVTSERLDYRIGISDQQARITRVELLFTYENTLSPPDQHRPIQATQALSRVYHEALPPAAVLQGEITSTQQSLTFPLPFQFDRATVVSRGMQFVVGDEPQYLRSIDIRLSTSSVVNNTVSVNVSGGVRTLAGAVPRFKAYFSLLGWDSRQVDVFETGTVHQRGLGHGAADLHTTIHDPGSLGGSDGSPERSWGRVAALEGVTLDCFLGLSVDDLVFSQAPEVTMTKDDDFVIGSLIERIPVLFQSDMAANVLFGPGVVESFYPESVQFVTYPKVTRSHGPEWDYPDWQMESFGLAGDVEATVAAVAARDMIIALDGPKRIQEVDLEIKGVRYNGRHVDVQVGGGVSVTSPDSNPEPQFYFVQPTYIGITPHTSKPDLVAETLEFGTPQGISGGRLTGGYVRNVGDGAAAFYDVKFWGDTEDFDLFIRYNGARIPFSTVSAYGLTLLAGEEFAVEGTFLPRTPGDRNAQLTFRNSHREVNMAVEGQVYTRAEWLPEHVNLGNVVVGESTVTFAALINPVNEPLWLDDFLLSGDTGDFQVEVPAPLSRQLRPGEHTRITIRFEPLQVSPSLPPLHGELKTLRITAITREGKYDLVVKAMHWLPRSRSCRCPTICAGQQSSESGRSTTPISH